mgnify:CR=1 FL=1
MNIDEVEMTELNEETSSATCQGVTRTPTSIVGDAILIIMFWPEDSTQLHGKSLIPYSCNVSDDRLSAK